MTINRTNPSAFDTFAAEYDSDFTHSTLGKLLRPRVWAKFSRHFSPGQHILELTCGTGEDAVWLAGQGVRVTATDGSAEMVKTAAAKAEAAGVTADVSVEQVSLQAVAAGYFTASRQAPDRDDGQTTESGQNSRQRDALAPAVGQSAPAVIFDGVYSNFGGLNTIGGRRSLAEALAGLVRPGGKVILTPMGPFCPWEIAWYLLHGQPKTAFRRLSKSGAPAKIGEAIIPIWYPSARRLRLDFSPWFRHLETESLGLWLPPSYIDHFVDRRPNFFARLNRLEAATASLTKGWGDHYIIVFEKTDRRPQTADRRNVSFSGDRRSTVGGRGAKSRCR